MRNGIAAADGPTREFSQKYPTTASAAGGRRVFTTLERLLRTHHINAEQCEAGGRFARDVLRGPGASIRSCLAISVGRSNGDGGPSHCRLEAMLRYKQAAAALEEARIDQAVSAHDLLLATILEERSLSEFSRWLNVRDDTIRSWIATSLGVLSAHYSRVDRAGGRISTRYTVEAALQRFDPVSVPA